MLAVAAADAVAVTAGAECMTGVELGVAAGVAGAALRFVTDAAVDVCVELLFVGVMLAAGAAETGLGCPNVRGVGRGEVDRSDKSAPGR
jgi:hypothetical protein